MPGDARLDSGPILWLGWCAAIPAARSDPMSR